MLKKVWSWVKSLFTKENIGIIWRKLLTSTKSAIATTISDPSIQQTAYDLVKELAGKELTGDQKREAFNEAMTECLKVMGKQIGESTLSAIRELAVSAMKAEDEQTK